MISTLPHFYSILPLIKYYRTYASYIHVIIMSTTFSILYHLYEESNDIITKIDYTFALLWLLYDIHFGYLTDTLNRIIIANFIVFLIHTQIQYNEAYTMNHSMWHILSAYKCLYVSTLLEKRFAGN